MSTGLLADAFGHHTWATLRLIDACLPLTDDQLATTVPGTYGSIIDTVRHTVGADSWYLFRLGGIDAPIEDDETMDLPALRAAMERHAAAWPSVLAADPDPDEVVGVRRDDGSATRAPKGIRLGQALHHGTDHRSQVCTALTALGIEPPAIDTWDYGRETGRVTEIPPTA